MANRIKMRRDTGASWTSTNPILADGEIGYDKTAKRAKMGDGGTAWTGLSYMTVTDYNDLTNKPTIPAAQVNADWNAASGVAQILNKPAIPAAQVNADWNATSGVAQILNKPAGVLLTDSSVIDGGAAAG